MADRVAHHKIICKGGLNTNENHLDLSENKPGAATRLVNFEPGLYGGYRRIEGYELLDSSFAEIGLGDAEGKVLTLATFKDDYSNESYVIGARKDVGANSYSFYKKVPLSNWQKLTTPTPRLMVDGFFSVEKIRHMNFNFGEGNQIVFVDGVNKGVLFDGQTWTDLEGDNALARPSIVTVFKDHLFVSGDLTKEAVVAHSAPRNPKDWSAAGGGAQLFGGFDIVQIKPFRDNLFIFGTNAINKATADINSTSFVVSPVTANVGCIARDSVLEIGGDLVFIAPDGLRPVAGTSRIGDVELETISKDVQLLFSELSNKFDLKTLDGVVIRSKSQIRYFVGDNSTDNVSSVGILGALRTSDQRAGWEFSNLLGIRASFATSGYMDGKEVVLHGDYDGKVYRQESGNSFAGEPMLAIFSCPYHDFGDWQAQKSVFRTSWFIRAEGKMEIATKLSYDWGDADYAAPNEYVEGVAGAPNIFGGVQVNYGEAAVKYGERITPILRVDTQGQGHSVQATLVSRGIHDPFTIQGLVFEYSFAGKR